MKQTTFKVLNGIASVIIFICMVIVASSIVGILVKSVVIAFKFGYGLI